MKEKRPSYVEQIPSVDWEKIPASVLELVEGMGQKIAHICIVFALPERLR